MPPTLPPPLPPPLPPRVPIGPRRSRRWIIVAAGLAIVAAVGVLALAIASSRAQDAARKKEIEDDQVRIKAQWYLDLRYGDQAGRHIVTRVERRDDAHWTAYSGLHEVDLEKKASGTFYALRIRFRGQVENAAPFDLGSIYIRMPRL
jgi:hypothetical protein